MSVRIRFVRAPAEVRASLSALVRDAIARRPRFTETLELLRAEDLLFLHVRLDGVVRRGDGTWAPPGAEPGRITFYFPPQHLFEQAVPENPPTPAPAAVDVRLAEPSRVVVEVPPGFGFVRSTRGLLDALTRLDMKLSSTARAEPIERDPLAMVPVTALPTSAATLARMSRLARSLTAAGLARAEVVHRIAGVSEVDVTGVHPLPRRPPEPPGADQTSIELPFRLLMAPTGGRWTHRITPPQASPAGRVELWHTRLGVVDPRGALDEDPGAPGRDAIAMWTTDWTSHPATRGKLLPEADPDLPRSALSPSDRSRIVRATADQGLGRRQPVQVRRWMLSALGGWIDLRGAWPGNPEIDSWEHRATLGRDQFVKVAIPGWLWPFGHRALRVTITERKVLERAPDRAILWQRRYLQILEPVRHWPGLSDTEDRKVPLASAEIRVHETPDVAMSDDESVPFRDGAPYRFPIAAADRDDGLVRFDVPMLWVPAKKAPGDKVLTAAELQDLYVKSCPGDTRWASLGGQRVGLVRSSADHPGDGRVETRALAFTGVLGGDHRGVPQLDRARLVVEAVRALTGKDDPMEVVYHAAYTASGLDDATGKAPSGNAARMMFDLAPGATPPGADFSSGSDKVGGFLTPSMAMTALSRSQGPVGSDLNAGFHPADFFKGLAGGAKLFGVFPLTDLIPAGTLDHAPKFITDALDTVQSVLAELKKWKDLAERIWGQVQAVLETVSTAVGALQPALAAALAAAGDPIDALVKAIEALFAAAWTELRPLIKGALPAPFPSDLADGLPATFELTAWQTYLETVARRAAAEAAKQVAGAIEWVTRAAQALIDQALAWLTAKLGAVAADVKAKVEAVLGVAMRLYGAWTQAQFVVAAVTALPDAFTGDDPAHQVPARIDMLGKLLGGLAGELGAIAGKLGGALDTAAALTADVRREIERRIGDAQHFVKTISDDFDKVLGVALKGFAMAEDLARNLTVRLTWKTPLQPLGFDPGFPIFTVPAPGDPADKSRWPSLTLEGELRGKAIKGKPAGVDLTAAIDAFDVNLIGKTKFLVLHFEKISFKLLAGQKPDLDVRFKKAGGIEFAGPLSFVETLRKLIPLDGFSDPPALDISAKGITAGFSLALPNLAIGVFSLQNLSLSAGFSIPFLGADPLTVRFAFCSREQPFVLTVSALGGGGFFAITINPHGVESMEAALEFGACLALDFGVASGSVSVMAGIYFKMGSGTVTLSGYLRVRGEVSVLGLISASLELYMTLTYVSATDAGGHEVGKVTGKASLEISVKVMFFSTSVKVEMEKKFAGANGDPTFLELMAGSSTDPLGPWNEYVGAFADAA